MGSQANLEKMQARQNYRNLWHAELTKAPMKDPAFCCFAFWCGPCVSYILRKRALYGDMSRYICCAGYNCLSGKFCESKCPECCLLCEVCLCFNSSVSSTRFLLQDEFNISTTGCDNCLIGFMVCVSQLACIFSLLACILGCDELKDIAECLTCIAETTMCIVCPCMQTQHKIEMDKRDGKFGDPPAMAVPSMQQMSRIDQPLPPTVGYPPQPYGHAPPAYGYPAPPPAPDYRPPVEKSLSDGMAAAPPGQPRQMDKSHSDQQLTNGYPPQQAANGYPPQQAANGYPPQQAASGYPPLHYPPNNAVYPPQ